MTNFQKICCNGRINPDCIDKSPVFTWNYTVDCDRDVVQKAYELRVFDRQGQPIFTKKGRGGVMRFVYTGKLQPLTDYDWQVTAKLSNGQTLESARQHFATGLLGTKWGQYGAKWIAGTKKYEHTAISFRRTFSVDKEVLWASAYLFATAWQRVSVNGKPLKEDHYFLPSNTPYAEKCSYEKYDLTAALKSGQNTLEVLTGGGYNGSYSQYGWRLCCGKALVGFVDICYTDGTKERIATDETWMLYSSQIVYCNIYNGEHFDATLTPQKLENARVITSPVKKAVFTANEMPPVKPVKRIAPISCRKQGRAHLYDMGENFAGVAELQIVAPKGTKICLQFSELVYETGEQRATTNRKAKAQDVYICSGEGTEIYKPAFTYHGYRYVQVTGLGPKVKAFALAGIALSADVSSASDFCCSDAVVNRIHENAMRSARSNLMTIPTDCPSRDERTPCAMDSLCVEVANIYRLDMHSYYRKWTEDLLVGADTADDHGNPDWDGDRILLAYRLLRYCGDDTVAGSYYNDLRHYLEALVNKSTDGLWYEGFGDWCHPNENNWETFHGSVEVVNSALFYEVTRRMAQLAGQLGKEADAVRYSQLAGKIQEAFLRKYVSADGTVNQGIHTEQAMALYTQILPECLVEPALNLLCEKLKTEPMDLGIFGIMAMAEVLPQYGHSELLLEMLRNPRYPGFLYQIANGATSLWEQWAFDGKMHSHNHAMFGGIEEAFYSGFAGIQPLENGFTRFQVKPMVPTSISFVSCTVETVSGVIQMAYRKHRAGVELTVAVPANTQAEVYLPDIGENSVLYDGEIIWNVGDREAGWRHLTLGGGHYQLRLIEKAYLFENTIENRYIFID